MKLKNKINIFLLLCASVILAPMASCVDDNLEVSNGTDDVLQGDGSYLMFQVDLLSLTRDGSVAFEDYEDYIDSKNVHIFFFYGNESNTEYDRLFKHFYSGEDELSFIPIATAKDPRVKNWYVRIPASDSEFAQKVRNNDFKIAILANSPKIPTELQEEKRDAEGKILTRGDLIQKLHHLSTGDTYQKDDKKGIYGFLFGENNTSGAMGLSVDWVAHNLGFTSESAAAPWIRQNWIPGKFYGEFLKESENIPQNTYKDLHMIWSFNGAIRYGMSASDPAASPSYKLEDDYSKYSDNAQEWGKKNSDDLSEWLTDNFAQTGLSDFEVLNDGEPVDNGMFKFIGAKTQGREKARLVLENGRYGILLPEGSKDENVIKIKLPASGHLTIEAAVYNPDNNLTEDKYAEIYAEIRNHEEDGDPTYTHISPGSINNLEVKITGDSEYLSIFCKPKEGYKNGRMIVYSIEFIQDIYLYETDRKGIPLSPEQLIPMYGIQTFKKLGIDNEGNQLWRPGTVFDLSNFNQLGPNPRPLPGQEELEDPLTSIPPYNYKTIPLIRSVAKVVLKIPKAMTDHHHVYLRCMNRTSRCEPMDVSTPTDEYWFDNDAENTHDANCEWHHLIGHEPFYDPSSEDLKAYQEKLAWYYGSWAKEGKIGNIDVPAKEFGKAGSSKDNTYPHIINPMINRSDFAEFIYTGEVEQMYKRYVLYVPEKFVDDPSTAGKMKSTPKICHIEFRDGTDSWTNLDDNNCFRLYFTEGGFNKDYDFPTFKKIEEKDENGNPVVKNEKTQYIYDTWENSYEKIPDNMKKHWPIMRNHVYNFTVEDANNRIVVMSLEVLPWKDVNVNNYNW